MQQILPIISMVIILIVAIVAAVICHIAGISPDGHFECAIGAGSIGASVILAIINLFN